MKYFYNENKSNYGHDGIYLQNDVLIKAEIIYKVIQIKDSN
jgi:hypothetical protein